jgi:hypothetical protein
VSRTRKWYEGRASAYQESAKRLDLALWGIVSDAARAPSTPHMRQLVRLAHRVERARDRTIAVAIIFELSASTAEES